MRHSIIRTILALLLVIAPPLMADAASDKKFFKKAAERVWNTRNEMFSTAVQIPDSVKEGASAVVLADYNFVDADYEFNQNVAITTSRTKRAYWTRRMVLLLDSKGVEDFSEFEFGERERYDAEFITFGGTDNAFGARIHKPGGEVVDVDLSQAVDMKEGKKDREKDVVSRKIAIPGLEPGDILEYFDYTEEWIDELDLPALDFVPVDKYPVVAYLFEGEFAPELTVEYRTYNGLPSPDRGKTDKGDNGIFLTLSYLDVVKDREYLRRFRQIPFLRINTLNNNSERRFYPGSKRRGGLYEHVSTGTIYRDIKYVLAVSDYDLPLPGRITGAVKDFRKAHPEATPRELVDAAWLAAVYFNLTNKKDVVSDYWLAIIFTDVLKKLDIVDPAQTGMAFINSRNDVPADMIMNWRQPDFGVLVGDSLYLPGTLMHYMPGEMPGEYQGENGGAFPGDRKKLTTLTEPEIFTTKTSRAAQNKITTKAHITIDPEANTAQGTAEIAMIGANKVMAGDLTDFNDWALAVEEYLGIPEGKRYKDKHFDLVERQKELAETGLELGKAMLGNTLTEVSDINVMERGILPGQPEMKMTMAFKAEGGVSDAGSDLLLSVGGFMGNNQRFEGDERQRQLDAFQSAPRQFSYSITFAMPEGYEADAASLQALQQNVSNKYGAYNASAKLEANGDVIVNVRERYNAYMVPADQWDQYLQISDAAAAFNDAVLLLKKK